MVASWVLRVGRFAYTVVTRAIDYQTPGNLARRYQQIQQQRNAAMSPRRIRELLEQHDHQAAAARQRTTGEPVRVPGVGQGDDPFGHGWLVLRRLAVVPELDFSGHHFGFMCHAPPRPCTLCVRRSAADAAGAIYQVQASHGDVLLVRRAHPEHPAIYMVLDVASSTSIVLPGGFSHRPLGSVGVMRPHDVLVTAILQEEEQQVQVEVPLELMCLSALAETSSHLLAHAAYPAEAARPWGNDGSVTQGDSIFFVDYTSGVIRSQASPTFLAPTGVSFVSFPGVGAGQNIRSVSGTKDHLVFIDMDAVGRLRTWKLVVTEQEQLWQPYADVELEQMATAAGLPRPDRIAFLHPLDGRTIYLLIPSAGQTAMIVATDLEERTISMVCSVPSAVAASRLLTMVLE